MTSVRTHGAIWEQMHGRVWPLVPTILALILGFTLGRVNDNSDDVEYSPDQTSERTRSTRTLRGCPSCPRENPSRRRSVNAYLGRVEDDLGHPLGGFLVDALPRVERRWLGALYATTTTKAQGEFRFDDTPPKKAVLYSLASSTHYKALVYPRR